MLVWILLKQWREGGIGSPVAKKSIVLKPTIAQVRRSQATAGA
jgi:hypothetical protein